MVTAIQDLAGEVGANNTFCARLDERMKALEARLEEGGPPPSAPRHKRRVTGKEAVFGGATFVALATSLLQALTSHSAPPAPAPPRPPVVVEAPK